MVRPIPRYLLPHTAKLLEVTEKDEWGKEKYLETELHFVRIEKCMTRKISVNADIPEAKAIMFFDCISSVPGDVSFENGDKIVFRGEIFVIKEIKELYADTDKIHHLEVSLI